MSERSGGVADSSFDARRLPSLISIVIPAYNEAATIRTAVEQVLQIVDDHHLPAEIIVVDDGSADGTQDEIRRLHATDARVKGIRFSRNFGKESALLAGLQNSAGEVVVTMDADLQHPPAVIPQLVTCWQSGAMIVNAVKRSRANDSWLVRTRAAAFNFVMMRLTGLDIRDSSDYKLLDRRVVDAIVHSMPEHHRFYRGLAAWIGYASASVPFHVAPRDAGEAKMSVRGLVKMAVAALLTFTAAPLRIVAWLGFLTLCFGFVIAAEALLSWWRGDAVSGFTTLICTLLLLGSAIMFSLAIIGQYLAMIYDEVKARPQYLIESGTGFNEPITDRPAQTPYLGHRMNSQRSASEIDPSRR